MDVRQRFPDLPPALPPPEFIEAVAVTHVNGDLAGVGVFFVITQTTPWGESLPIAEQEIVPTGGHNAVFIQVEASPAATMVNVYIALLGTGAGSEAVYFSYPAGDGVGITILSTTTAIVQVTNLPISSNIGIPPIRSTAFLPDSDGNFVGVYAMYRMLKRALDAMVKLCNGITDRTGIQAQVGQEFYSVVPPNASAWMNFTNVWFDGYPLQVVPRRLIFQRNIVVGFSGLVAFEGDAPNPIMQLWPQTNRQGGQSPLTVAMLATDTVANVSSTAAFLSLGMMQIDNEIMAYSQAGSSTQFTGLFRGLGGTLPAAHAVGAIATELNIQLSGKRLAPSYVPGNAALTIAVPPAWESPLADHMLAQLRSAEGDDATAKELMGGFAQECALISRGSNGPTKPRQIQIGSGFSGQDSYNVNGVGFGWLIE